jgi:shikimate dehydrogenase
LINAAVLGSPINHSLSPVLHRVAYELLGLNGSYEAIEVRAGELSSFLLGTDKNCLSLTMPLKEEAISLSSVSSDLAQRISSGNTLTLLDGNWHLTSTDVAGFEFSLKAHQVEKLESVVVLGAGATARAAVSYLSTISKKIQVVSRNSDREAKMNKASEIEIEYLPWQPNEVINHADLVLNTAPGDASHVFLPSIQSPRGTLFEVLYDPWPTAISQKWEDSGREVIDGLELLIHQAISQIELFSESTLDRAALYGDLRKAAISKIG